MTVHSLDYADTTAPTAPLTGVLRHLVAPRTSGADPRPHLVAALIPADQVPVGATILGTLLVTREGLTAATRDGATTYREKPPAPAAGEGLRVDPDARTVLVFGHTVSLTRLEFDLLALLVATPRRVFTRAQLHTSIWEGNSPGGARTVDVHVHRLRHKLGPAHEPHLVTVRGVGYRWDPDAKETTPQTHREANR
jgi:DNA-binding winged helix-turn-helix (wHTH) protein